MEAESLRRRMVAEGRPQAEIDAAIGSGHQDGQEDPVEVIKSWEDLEGEASLEMGHSDIPLDAGVVVQETPLHEPGRNLKVILHGGAAARHRALQAVAASASAAAAARSGEPFQEVTSAGTGATLGRPSLMGGGRRQAPPGSGMSQFFAPVGAGAQGPKPKQLFGESSPASSAAASRGGLLTGLSGSAAASAAGLGGAGLINARSGSLDGGHAADQRTLVELVVERADMGEEGAVRAALTHVKPVSVEVRSALLLLLLPITQHWSLLLPPYVASPVSSLAYSDSSPTPPPPSTV